MPPSSVLAADEKWGERFWQKVLKDPFEEEEATGCWLWQKRKKPNGYGQVFFRYRRHKYGLQAHRVAWMLQHRRWPSKTRDIDHVCGNRACCNPAHLRQRRPELNSNNKAPRRQTQWNWKNQHGQG